MQTKIKKFAVFTVLFLTIFFNIKTLNAAQETKTVYKTQSLSKKIQNKVKQFENYREKNPIEGNLLAISTIITISFVAATIISPFIACFTPVQFPQEHAALSKQVKNFKIPLHFPMKINNEWKIKTLFTVGWKNHNCMLKRLFKTGESVKNN